VSPTGAASAGRAALGVVYVAVFIDLLGFGILLPSLPFYARVLGASGFKLGVLFTAYSGGQLLGSAILGRLSDARGRRPILLLSLLGSSLSMVLSGLAGSLLTLCLARALAGLFGGSIATAQAYIADVTPVQGRAAYMGRLGAAIGLGFVLGPALGAGVRWLGYGFPGAAFTAAFLAAVNLAVAAYRLPESKGEGQSAGVRPGLAGWWRTVSRSGLSRPFAAVFAATSAFVALETTLAYLTRDRFALPERWFGAVLVFVGFVVILVQGGLVGRITRRFGVRPVATAGSLLMGAALAVLPFSASLAAMLGLLGLAAAGQALTSPTLSTLVSQGGTIEEHGTLLGVSQSLAAAARAVSPLLAGALYDRHPAAPYVWGGLLAFVASLLVAGRSEP
jgi:DHA1 family tetracycline resistance protein-like MFS transporter